MSQHIGDMGSLETLAAFERSVEQFARMYGVCPETVAADDHPGYQTREWAHRYVASGSRADPAGCVELVQHHHAHVAAVMAEHDVAGRRPGARFCLRWHGVWHRWCHLGR